MRHLTLSAALLAALALLPGSAPAQGSVEQPVSQVPTTCKVIYVLDGDTINCEDGVMVRLLLVDVPDRGRFGDEARAFVVGLLPKGTELRLEYDRNPRDSEGRWLAYAYLPDGSLLNKRLVEGGYAYVEFSTANRAKLDELRSAEQNARRQTLGLWSQ
ncbi:MAG TPA: thermonuclease family protein [Gemmatimonadota bacterium]|nr:thermonuclease family protein [Gemmatimonadota bacterium]